VGNSRLVDTNIVVITEVEESLPRELGIVVGDDRVGYAETDNDVGEEGHRLLRANVDDGSSLDPLGELVDCHEEVSEAPGRLLERSHHVEVPHGKRPCDGDGLEHLRREMSWSSIELAPFTASYDVLGVCDRCGTVETFLESISDKRSRTDVVTAGTGMYLS
jgi:hypothetical protein